MRPPIDPAIEVERYELDEAVPYRFELERREFLHIFGVMGGGVLVASMPAAAQESGRGGRQAPPADVSAWVHVDERGHVTGYTGTYDGLAHGATGSATGVQGEDLSGLDLGATFTDAPGGTATWTFDGGTNYNDQTGTVAVTIARANATVPH